MPGKGNFLPFALCVMAFLAIYLVVRLPDVHTDARAFHLAAPEMYLLEHRIFIERWNFEWHTPMAMEMLFMLGWSLGGVVAAKMFNLALVLMTALFLGAASRGIWGGKNPGRGWWEAFLFLSTGLLLALASDAKNDIAMAAYGV